MTDNKKSEAFEAAFDAFQKLSTEEKATFLVETVVGTVVSGLEEVSEVVAEAVRRAAEPCDSAAGSDNDDSEENAS